MTRCVVLLLLLLSSLGCSAIGATPTPEPCYIAAADYYPEAIEVVERMNDLDAIIFSAPLSALPDLIQDYQELRRETDGLAVPLCAQAAQQALLEEIDEKIRAYLAKLAGSDATVRYHAGLAGEAAVRFATELRNIKPPDGTP